MAESPVVSALVRKRAELAGEIEALERRIDDIRASLIHVDTVLRMFAPDEVPEAIPPKHPRPAQADWFARGELSRRIFDALRPADGPLCAREIALRLVQAKGLDPEDRAVVGAFTKRVDQALRRMRREGNVTAERGPGMTMVWRLEQGT